jgi:hypothetical protein
MIAQKGIWSTEGLPEDRDTDREIELKQVNRKENRELHKMIYRQADNR